MVGGSFDRELSRTRIQPVPAARTNRMHEVRALTSLPAGRVVPIAGIPLLREDGMKGNFRFSFEMMETVEILLNAVNVNIKAYLVPYLAFNRFDSMDALNRSYQGVAVEGLSVVPFFTTTAAGLPASGQAIMKYMGMHFKTGNTVNWAYVEAYNSIWNFRAKNRSRDLTPRTELDASLAPAFWDHQHFRHIVPDFDQAVIDGEVPLNVVSSSIPVKGLAWAPGPAYLAAGVAVNPSGTGGVQETTVATAGQRWFSNTSTNPHSMLKEDAAHAGFPGVFAEMQADGITVSLSNIELARKTQAFARLREQYVGLTDDYIIDLLMQGISVPEQALNQPILLADKSTIFGMSKRYATDSAALTESVVSGATFIDISVRVPPISCGGIVMLTAEITPEQLFERQRDPLLHTPNTNALPDYLRDTLDPEKVEIVTNGQIDAAHATPNGTFGYEPLHAKWITQQPRIGGRFHREDPTSVLNDEDRQRIWAVETINPSLAADFYICTNIHTKPFVVQNQDPFECVCRGAAVINGITVFGGALLESTGSYEEVMAEAPMGRLPTHGALMETEVPEGEAKPAPKASSTPKPKEKSPKPTSS